jgi:PAS domain S-box-containing protein
VHVLYDLFRSSDPDTGNTTNYSTVTRDITEYKQAEKALRDRQEQLSLALMGADLGTWDWKIQTGDVQFNDRWAEMLGYSLDELKPHISTWEKLTHPDDLTKAREKLNAHFAGKTPYYEAEIRMMYKSGQWIWILDRGKVIERDSEAKPVRACGTHLDITDRKKLEENLRRAQKTETVGTLAGGVAHEFNNIIGGMMGYAEVAKDIVLEANPANEMLDRILELGSRASDIVRQMLAFSREHETSKSLIRPHVAIKEQIKMLSNIIPASIEIKTGIDESAGSIMANATQLQQVGMNLCTNAVHAMEEKGGVLTITLSQVYLDEEAAQPFQNIRPGHYIKITVGDTGPGIDPAIADRIFDPFFTTKEVNKGTGLGLSVVDGIVRDHGGAITVESTPGTGTVFTVVLPAAEGKKSEDQEEKTADIRGGTERILLVDDEESIIFTMKVILERLGYRVTALTGSIKALQMFRAAPHDFDLIITDLTMPGLTGDNLSAEILSIRPDIPVILMTGYEDMVESDRINMSCVKAFMPKPCKKPELAGTIRRVLDGQ